MTELAKLQRGAIRHLQYAAAVRAAELQARMEGLLIERAEIKVEHVDVGSAMAEAKGRVQWMRENREPEVEDVEFEMVKQTAPVDPFS